MVAVEFLGIVKVVAGVWLGGRVEVAGVLEAGAEMERWWCWCWRRRQGFIFIVLLLPKHYDSTTYHDQFTGFNLRVKSV